MSEIEQIGLHFHWENKADVACRTLERKYEKVRGVVEYAKGWKLSVVREFVKMSRKCSIHGKCEKCEKYEYDQNPINMPLDLTRYAAFGVFVGFPKVM